ncbi:hypothetical protein LJ739_15825 [Aestuariibacter halophilus]|uniref:PEP-CTERM protein-sorting domain-containing protein n=1 Tax=Fluctibacter halophilus TaxID=226011 RepID=A0ABS8GC82_9ALTE|nr:hypothetical protein [Aestuariibacter halophilus]MCC2617721.1 hypothetical protein [Aestuariibacter halophilus]
MKNTLFKVVLLGTLFVSTHLSAALVTWNFTGSVIVTQSDADYQDTYFDDNTGIRVGDRVEGSVSWDPEVDPLDSWWFEDQMVIESVLRQPIDIQASFFTASGIETLHVSGLGIPYMIQNWDLSAGMVGSPPGRYDVLSLITYEGDISAYFRLIAPAFSNLFALDGFNPAPPSLDDLDLGRLHFTYDNDVTGQADSVFIQFDSLSVAAVSEPSTMMMALLGSWLLLRRGRKHVRNQKTQ